MWCSLTVGLLSSRGLFFPLQYLRGVCRVFSLAVTTWFVPMVFLLHLPSFFTSFCFIRAFLFRQRCHHWKGLGCTWDSAFFKFLFIDSITLLLLHRRKFVSMIVKVLCCAAIYESGVVLVWQWNADCARSPLVARQSR